MSTIILSGSVGASGTPILGSVAIANTDADHTMAVAETTNYFVRVTGAQTADRKLVAPAVQGTTYEVQNATSGGFNVNVIAASGTGVLVPPAGVVICTFDGTNYVASVGLAGPTGATGATGPTGPTGPQGIFGGSIAFDLQFDTATANANPAAGFLRLNNATENTATAAYVSKTDTNSTDISAGLATFDGSTSTVKGYIRFVNKTDNTKWILFSLASRTDHTNYSEFALTEVSSSAASPFSVNDHLIVHFSRTGDVGSAGGAGATGATGATGPAPAGTGIVTVTSGALNTPGALTGSVTTSGAALATTVVQIDGSGTTDYGNSGTQCDIFSTQNTTAAGTSFESAGLNVGVNLTATGTTYVTICTIPIVNNTAFAFTAKLFAANYYAATQTQISGDVQLMSIEFVCTVTNSGTVAMTSQNGISSSATTITLSAQNITNNVGGAGGNTSTFVFQATVSGSNILVQVKPGLNNTIYRMNVIEQILNRLF